MTWYDEDWPRRTAVSVNNISGAATIDAQLAIPSDWPEFWSHVQSDGDDVRVTKADGVTLLSYDLDSWDYAAKTGNIQIDGYSGIPNSGQDATLQIFIYWGHATAADASSSVSISSAKTMTVHLAQPGTGGYPVIRCRPPAIDVDIASSVITKQSTETIRVWWDLRDMMAIRGIRNEASKRLEEIDYFTFNVVTAIDGDAAAALFDETENYVADPHFISTLLKAGGDDSNYLMTLTVYTTEGRVLDFRATLKVNDLSASLVTV